MSKATERNARELLKSIGIGDFNATMIIPYVWVAPATSDPKSTQIMLIVKHLQNQLNMLGAGLVPNGYLDASTARALRLLSGPRWSSLSWAQNIAAVADAVAGGKQIAPAPTDMDGAMRPMGVSQAAGPLVTDKGALGLDLGLPDVPGGIITYGIAAFFLYRHLKKRGHV